MSSPRARPALFARDSWPEPRRTTAILRTETAGGVLLIIAAAIGLIWANTPWSNAYEALRDFQVGPAGLHLNLSLETWAAEGLLAVFFAAGVIIGGLGGSADSLTDRITLGILVGLVAGKAVGTLTAALPATIVLGARNRVYRRIAEEETRDDDNAGIPDIYYQQGA